MIDPYPLPEGHKIGTFEFDGFYLLKYQPSAIGSNIASGFQRLLKQEVEDPIKFIYEPIKHDQKPIERYETLESKADKYKAIGEDGEIKVTEVLKHYTTNTVLNQEELRGFNLRINKEADFYLIVKK